jgi:hypothetical protein
MFLKMICTVPALVTLLVSGAADTFAIVDVDAADAMMGLGSQVTQKLLEVAASQKLTVVPPEKLRTLLPSEKYQALRKCQGNTACVSAAFAGTSVTRAITGQLSRDERNYLLRLWHHDVRGTKLVCDVDRAVLIAARRFQKDVDQAVPALLKGEREARGQLSIEANVANAQLSLNGEFMGTPPMTLTLKPGKYEIKLVKNKYLPVTRLVAVEANQTTTEKVKLLLMPGQTPDDDVVAASKPGTEAAGVSGGLTLRPPTIVLGILTMLTGSSAAIFGLISNRQETDLRAGYNAMTNVYQGTRADALEQNRNALVANVSLIALGAAAVATVVFLVIDLVSGNRAPTSPVKEMP